MTVGIDPIWQDPPAVLGELPFGQKIVAIVIAVSMLVGILELVRRRKLREEYSYVWFGTAVVLMALALEPRLLTMFQTVIGAQLPTTALFFGALMFLMLVSLLMSLRLSRLTIRNKSLTQRSALAQHEIDDLRAQVAALRKDLDELRRSERRKDGVA